MREQPIFIIQQGNSGFAGQSDPVGKVSAEVAFAKIDMAGLSFIIKEEW
jgi:hypothetical protein